MNFCPHCFRAFRDPSVPRHFFCTSDVNLRRNDYLDLWKGTLRAARGNFQQLEQCHPRLFEKASQTTRGRILRLENFCSKFTRVLTSSLDVRKIYQFCTGLISQKSSKIA